MATVIVNPGNTLIVSAPGPQGPQGAGGGGGGGSGTVTSVTAGDGLLGGTITTSGTIDVNFGSAGNTVCEGNDARLSDARTPTTHSHVAGDIGSITGPALIGRSAATTGTAEAITLGSGLTIDGSKQLTISASYAQQSVTMTAGTGLTGGGDLSANRTFAVAYGTSASTACEGNDARLSDARTPTAHTHALADLQQSGATTNQVVTWNGSAWAPSSPSGTGTVTSVTGGTGLSGGTHDARTRRRCGEGRLLLRDRLAHARTERDHARRRDHGPGAGVVRLRVGACNSERRRRWRRASRH